MYRKMQTNMKNAINYVRPTSFIPFFLAMGVVMLGYLIHSTGLRPLDVFRHQAPKVEKIPMEKVIQKKINKSPKNAFKIYSNPLVPKAEAASNLQARSYIVVDQNTGEVLSSSHETDAIPVASLTKVMTSVVALDLATPDTLITISKSAKQQVPTKIGVVPGQKMTVSELLHAMLLTSANDAAEAVRDGIDATYGKGAFMIAMNEKAKALGLSNTHFENPEGFDNPTNYSSAHDLAILASYALKNYPLISKIAQKDYAFLPKDKNHKQFDLYNWNGLLGVYPGVVGLKIGNTSRAGYTTIVSATRDKTSLLTVVLGEPDVIGRDSEAAFLLDQAFENTHGLQPISVTREQLLAKYATWKYWN